MARSGMMIAIFLFAKQAPPNNAIAPIGVKLGGCGRTRVSAAIKIAQVINRKRGVKNEGRVSDFIIY